MSIGIVNKNGTLNDGAFYSREDVNELLKNSGGGGGGVTEAQVKGWINESAAAIESEIDTLDETLRALISGADAVEKLTLNYGDGEGEYYINNAAGEHLTTQQMLNMRRAGKILVLGVNISSVIPDSEQVVLICSGQSDVGDRLAFTSVYYDDASDTMRSATIAIDGEQATGPIYYLSEMIVQTDVVTRGQVARCTLTEYEGGPWEMTVNWAPHSASKITPTYIAEMAQKGLLTEMITNISFANGKRMKAVMHVTWVDANTVRLAGITQDNMRPKGILHYLSFPTYTDTPSTWECNYTYLDLGKPSIPGLSTVDLGELRWGVNVSQSMLYLFPQGEFSDTQYTGEHVLYTDYNINGKIGSCQIPPEIPPYTASFDTSAVDWGNLLLFTNNWGRTPFNVTVDTNQGDPSLKFEDDNWTTPITLDDDSVGYVGYAIKISLLF